MISTLYPYFVYCIAAVSICGYILYTSLPQFPLVVVFCILYCLSFHLWLYFVYCIAPVSVCVCNFYAVLPQFPYVVVFVYCIAQ